MSHLYTVLLTSGIGTLLALIVTSVYNWIKDKTHDGGKKLNARLDELTNRLNSLDTKIDDVKATVENSEQHVTNTTDQALQALLRNKLYEIYDYWILKEYAPTDVKENFENLYQKYHTLGKNGVMDEKHKAFMSLPDVKQNKEKKQ